MNRIARSPSVFTFCFSLTLSLLLSTTPLLYDPLLRSITLFYCPLHYYSLLSTPLYSPPSLSFLSLIIYKFPLRERACVERAECDGKIERVEKVRDRSDALNRIARSPSVFTFCFSLTLSLLLSTTLLHYDLLLHSTTLFYLSTTPYYSLLLSTGPRYSRIPILTSRFATSLYFFSTLYSTLSLSLSLRFLSLLILYPFPLRERARV